MAKSAKKYRTVRAAGPYKPSFSDFFTNSKLSEIYNHETMKFWGGGVLVAYLKIARKQLNGWWSWPFKLVLNKCAYCQLPCIHVGQHKAAQNHSRVSLGRPLRKNGGRKLPQGRPSGWPRTQRTHPEAPAGIWKGIWARLLVVGTIRAGRGGQLHPPPHGQEGGATTDRISGVPVGAIRIQEGATELMKNREGNKCCIISSNL